MQLTYVFSELGQGLRRNLSMHVAVVLTLFVSLTLVGIGALLYLETKKTEEFLGSEVSITFYLCNEAPSENCDRAVTPAEEKHIEKTVEDNPEVAGFHTEDQQEAYDKAKELLGADLLSITSPKALHKSVWIDLKDPQEYDGVVSAVEGLPGVHSVKDNHEILGKIFRVMDRLQWGAFITAGVLVVAALLLVANTIRLAAFARRREIGIMRLVGASSLYISLPFLLEAVVTAIIGVALASGGLAAFVWVGIHQGLSDVADFLPWVGLE